MLLGFLIVVISGCGFHLRGIQNKPRWLNTVAIINQTPDSYIEKSLRVVLDAYKIAVTENHTQADAWIILKGAGYTQTISSVGSGSNPRQYLLIYFIDYSIQKPNGDLIQNHTHLTVSRQLTINNNRVLGSDQEASLLIAEMRQEVIIKLLNRLNY